MLDRWTPGAGLGWQERTQVLPSLRGEVREAEQSQGLWRHGAETWMLAGSTNHMSLCGTGLMPPPELGPVQPYHSAPSRLAPDLQQAMDLCHRYRL